MSTLFFANLGSGSKGNCTYIGDRHSGVLIDCGISCRQIFARLEGLGLPQPTIEAVLITHEHADHVAACRVLENRLNKSQTKAAVFAMTAGTAAGLHPKVRPTQVEHVRAGHPFRVGQWLIEPYSVPHDTRDPVAYIVEGRGVRAGVISDLGRSTRLVERQLASMDVALVEFNHDTEMLLNGSYPWHLKQRISGPQGHLSNDQAAELLTRGASTRLRHVLLGHVSEENNSPHLVLAAAQAAIHRSVNPDIVVELADQRNPTILQIGPRLPEPVIVDQPLTAQCSLFAEPHPSQESVASRASRYGPPRRG
jgi:phosphoribosyl 1,2-cyclic phosphodiesterase